MQTNQLKILTLNVRGLNDCNERRKLFSWLKDTKPDIKCLQETFCTSKLLPLFNSEWTGKAYHSLSDSSHSRGVAILVSSNLNYEVIDHHTMTLTFYYQGILIVACVK